MVSNVKITGDQTVAGIKTFSSIPVLPASDPTTANQAARKAYVDSLVAQTTGSLVVTYNGHDMTIYYTKMGKTYLNIHATYYDGSPFVIGGTSLTESAQKIATLLGKTYASYTSSTFQFSAGGNASSLQIYWNGSAWTYYDNYSGGGAKQVGFVSSITVS